MARCGPICRRRKRLREERITELEQLQSVGEDARTQALARLEKERNFWVEQLELLAIDNDASEEDELARIGLYGGVALLFFLTFVLARTL